MNGTITLTPAMLALVPIVTMIMQMLKQMKPYYRIKAYTPIITCGISVGLAFAVSISNPIVAGIIIGVTASAGYDQFKASKK